MSGPTIHQQYLVLDADETYKSNGGIKLVEPNGLMLIKGEKIFNRHKIEAPELEVHAKQKIKFDPGSEIKAKKANLSAYKMELRGDIDVENIHVFAEDSLIVSSGVIKSLKASLASSRYTNLTQLSQFLILEELQLRNPSQELLISGKVTSSVTDMIGNYVDLTGASKVDHIDRLNIDADKKAALRGALQINTEGKVSVAADEIEIDRSKIKGASGSELTVKAKKTDISLEKSLIDGVSKITFEATKSIKTDFETKIEKADLVSLTADEVDFAGDIQADLVVGSGRVIRYRGRVLDAGDVHFFADKEIDIGTYTYLHVLHRLRLESNQVKIRGKS